MKQRPHVKLYTDHLVDFRNLTVEQYEIYLWLIGLVELDGTAYYSHLQKMDLLEDKGISNSDFNTAIGCLERSCFIRGMTNRRYRLNDRYVGV